MLAAVRGGGIKALAAMPQWRKLDEETQIWRPLLTFPRKELENYAAACNLPNIEDERYDLQSVSSDPAQSVYSDFFLFHGRFLHLSGLKYRSNSMTMPYPR